MSLRNILCYRKELDKRAQQQLADWQSMAAAEKQKQTDEYLRHHHFLVSTAVTPGIYNSPYRVCAYVFSHMQKIF